eukprot:5667538-Prymnesium_polylepis.1
MPFRLCCKAVARDSGYNTIAVMSDAVDGRSAARCRNTIVQKNVTFLRSHSVTHSPWAAARRYTPQTSHETRRDESALLSCL